MAATENEPDNLHRLSEDDASLVITLIDPVVFHDLMRAARHGPLAALPEASYRQVPEHDLVAHDFAEAYGLVMIPPLPSPVAAMPLEALREECKKRRVGIVSGKIAYALARLCNARGALATEAAFDRVVLTRPLVEFLREDIAANDYNREGTYIDLNDRSERGVQNLMGALVRRWGKHIRVVDQPDESIVTNLATSMSRLQSACWEHPPRDAVEATTASIIVDQDVQFNFPGLQGLALGNKLHKNIRLSIKGLPLSGLGSRIRAYVKIESNIVPDENGGPGDNNTEDDPDLTTQSYDILRDSVKGLVKLRCLVDAPQDPTDQEINNLTAISFSPLASPPTPDDMAALKHIILSAHKLESLTIKGNMENPPDGRAGAFIPASDASRPQPAGSDFYLPPFQFLPQDRFPPLLHLHLWRYDWRHHSTFDVDTHWDLSQLQALTFDGAPLRWFLGTLRLTNLRFLHTLRLEDAEWSLHPLHSQQAAIIIGYILSYYVHSLRRLELIRVYTNRVPLAAFRRHAATLEHVALRHPYGIGFGPGGLTPSMASRMLLAMLQRGDEASNRMNVMAVALGSNGVVHPTTSNADSNPRDPDTIPNRPTTTAGPHETEGSNANGTETTFHANGASSADPADNINSINSAAGVDTTPGVDAQQNAAPAEPAEPAAPAADSHLPPSLSRLLSPEADMDDRLNTDQQEPEVLTRLVRLSQLRRVTVAVPSGLDRLGSEPSYDNDINSVLARLVFMLNQRQQIMSHQQSLHQQNGYRTQGPAMELLEQVAFYIDGCEPRRDLGHDGAESTSTSANAITNTCAGSSTTVAQCAPQATSADAAAAVHAASVASRPLTASAPHPGAASPVKRCLVAELVRLSSLESLRKRSRDDTEEDGEDETKEDFQGPSARICTGIATRSAPSAPGILGFAAHSVHSVGSANAGSPFGSPSSLSSALSPESIRSDAGPYDCTKYVYVLYEESNDESDHRLSAGVHPVPEDLDDYSAYVNEHDQTVSYSETVQNGTRQPTRRRLPYIVQFACPSDLSEPKWDVVGVPQWE